MIGIVRAYGFLLILCSGLFGFAAHVFAEGYSIDPQSAEGMAVSQAGIPTGYSDGSAGFYNPAALVIDPQYKISMQGHLLHARAKFRDNGSDVLGVPNTGSRGSDGGKTAVVPTMYSVLPIREGVVGALYLNSPFGLGTKFPIDWVGRYQNVETSMVTANLGGSVGVEVLDGLSIGGGLSALYADVLFSNAIDFGTIGASLLGPQGAESLGLLPQQADGKVRIRASDWGLGWNTGFLYRFGCEKQYRIGVSYRGATDLDFHGGSVSYSVPSAAQPLTTSGVFTPTQARSSITLPESLSLGVRIPISEEVILVQQSTWTRWSRAQKISISFANATQPPIQEALEWESSWLHTLGFIWTATDQLQFSAGGGFEDGVIPSVQRRSPRLPTSDGIWSSVGVGYTLPQSRMRFDIAYARLDFRGGGATSQGPTGDTLRGDWEALNQALSFSTSFWW